MRRLAFADDVNAPYDSMLAFPAAAGQFINGALDTVMSITSRLLPWEVQSTSRPNSHNSVPGGEEMYKKYANALQLHSIHFGEDMKASENMEFISQGARFVPTSFTFVHGTQRPSPHTARRLDKQCAVFIGPHRRFGRLRAASTRSSRARATGPGARRSPPTSSSAAGQCHPSLFASQTRFQAMQGGDAEKCLLKTARDSWFHSWPRRRR